MKWLRLILTLVSATLSVTGCAIRPELHLRKPVETQVQLETQVNVEVMWQVDWQAKWEFNWDVSSMGSLGYTLPAGMRLHLYPLDSEGVPTTHSEHNFAGSLTRLDVLTGTYNFLFHNNDSEALQFTYEGEFDDVICTTRIISPGLKTSEAVYSSQQKAAGYTKAPSMEDDPVSLAPEWLYSLFDEALFVSDNLEDLTYEDGKYILKLEGELLPSTFIYLFQVKLLHNDGRVTGSNGGAAITGMASGVNLMTRQTLESTVTVPMEMYKDPQQDMLGAKVYTFGIPGCNPYVDSSVKSADDGEHFLVINVSYANNTYRNIRVNITDQVRALPTGGVITLELDVDDFPPEEGGEESGGFKALVEEWDEETGETTIKY